MPLKQKPKVLVQVLFLTLPAKNGTVFSWHFFQHSINRLAVCRTLVNNRNCHTGSLLAQAHIFS